MKLRIDPITIGIIVLLGMLIYGNCQQKAHAAEPWFDLSLTPENILKPNAYPSMGIRINHIEDGWSAAAIFDSGLCVKVRGICFVNPIFYGSIYQVEPNNIPVSAGVGARSFLKILSVGYGYNTDAGGDETRAMIDLVALGKASYQAIAR